MTPCMSYKLGHAPCTSHKPGRLPCASYEPRPSHACPMKLNTPMHVPFIPCPRQCHKICLLPCLLPVYQVLFLTPHQFISSTKTLTLKSPSNKVSLLDCLFFFLSLFLNVGIGRQAFGTKGSFKAFRGDPEES